MPYRPGIEKTTTDPGEIAWHSRSVSEVLPRVLEAHGWRRNPERGPDAPWMKYGSGLRLAPEALDMMRNDPEMALDILRRHGLDEEADTYGQALGKLPQLLHADHAFGQARRNAPRRI